MLDKCLLLSSVEYRKKTPRLQLTLPQFPCSCGWYCCFGVGESSWVSTQISICDKQLLRHSFQSYSTPVRQHCSCTCLSGFSYPQACAFDSQQPKPSLIMMLHSCLLVATISDEALAAKLYSSRSLSAFLGNPFSLLMCCSLHKKCLKFIQSLWMMSWAP